MNTFNAVENLDFDRYIDKWYEIGRLPNRFEKGLVCVTAVYSFRTDGKVKVLNSGHSEGDKNKVNAATGKVYKTSQDCL